MRPGMLRIALGVLLGGLVLAAGLSAAAAQEKDRDDVEEFRRLRRLETPLDFWVAVQFELDLGKPDIAARYLRGLVAKKPGEKDLYAILDRDGLAAVLRLRNVPTWSSDKKEEDETRKAAEELIRLATQAQKKRLADAARVRRLIADLRATPEEQAHAQRELDTIGAPAVPYLVEAHLRAKDASEGLAVQKALRAMGPATIPPLLATLDSRSPLLELDILDVLRERHARHAKEIAPFLVYVAASKDQPGLVRK